MVHPLQTGAQAGGQQLEYGVLGFLIVGEGAFRYVFGVHNRGGQHVVPQQVLIDPVQSGIGLFKETDHLDKGIEMGKVPYLVVLWKKRAVPEGMVKNGLVRVGRPEEPHPSRRHAACAYHYESILYTVLVSLAIKTSRMSSGKFFSLSKKY